MAGPHGTDLCLYISIFAPSHIRVRENSLGWLVETCMSPWRAPVIQGDAGVSREHGCGTAILEATHLSNLLE